MGAGQATRYFASIAAITLMAAPVRAADEAATQGRGMTLLVTVGLFFGLAVAVYRFFAWIEERGRAGSVSTAEPGPDGKAKAVQGGSVAEGPTSATAASVAVEPVPSAGEGQTPVPQRVLPRLPDAEVNPVALALMVKAAAASVAPPESVLRPKAVPAAPLPEPVPTDLGHASEASETVALPAIVPPPLPMPVFASLPDGLIPGRLEQPGGPAPLMPANDDGDASQQAAQ